VSRLKKLRSLFIEDEQPAKEPAKKRDAKTKEKSVAGSVSSAKTTTPPNFTVNAKSDEKIMDTLLGAVEKANLEGFDYLEYKKSLQSLKKMSMNEETMYQSAFATAATMGLTLNRLIETAEYYKKILDKEMHTFGETVATQHQQMVVKRKETAALVNENITQKQKQIEQLQTEIKNLKEKQTKLNKEVEQSSTKIEQTKANFEKSFLSLKDQFESDIIKMKKYFCCGCWAFSRCRLVNIK